MYRILLVTLLIAVLPAAGRENRVAGSAAPALEAEDEPARHTLLDHAAGVGFRIDLPAAATPPAAPKARGPMRIGFHRDVPMAWQGDLLPRLDWTPLGNGTVAAALWVSSPEAISIRVGVRAHLPEGAEVRFFHPDRGGVSHTITPADFHFPLGQPDVQVGNPQEAASVPNGGHEKGGVTSEPEILWSPSIDGDVIGIEIMLPSLAVTDVSWFRVEKVAHRFVDPGATHYKALDCPDLHVDVQCRVGEFPAGLENAVARVEYEVGGISASCTGTLLNDADSETSIPYFLTANHCVSTAKVARTVQTTWFYQRGSCDVETLDARTTTVAGGAELLATSVPQDSTLLRIRQRLPANVYFAGWDATPAQSDELVVGIHHPKREVKKYAAGVVLGTEDSEGVDGAIKMTWDEGVTEGGSSGSALFREGHVIGALSHGSNCDSQSYRDFYGSFADFFPRVCSTLDPHNGCGDGEHDLSATAATISTGGTGAGAIDEAGDFDYWRISIPSRGMLIAYTTGDADTIGTLEDGQDTVLATNDNSGMGLNFRIERNVEAGTYFVRVAAAEDSLGAYVLHVDHAPSSIDDLPELPLQASSSDQAISAPDGVDRWRLEVESDGFIALFTEGSTDTIGTLENASGEVLDSNDDDHEDDINFRIERFLSAGTYVLQVRGYRDAVGPYTLHARHTALVDVPVPAVDGSAGQVVVPKGSEYWRINVTSLSVSTLETTGSTDTTGALHIASGEQVATDDDGGADFNFRIERVLVPGTYYARVGAYGDDTGAYNVRAAHTPLANADVFDVDMDGRGTGAIDEAGEVDTWRFEVAEPAEVVVRTTGSMDTFGSLEDGLGRALTNDDGGSGQNFRIVDALESGTYFVRVRGYESTTGTYALHVQADADIGDTRSAAAMLAIEGAQDSVIAPAGDVDYWRIDVPSRGTLVVESDGTTDTLGAIEDVAGSLLARDDDSGSRLNFRIEHQVAPGVYFLRVSGFGTSAGDYTLRLSYTRDALTIPWFLAAHDASSSRQGFARLINRSDRSGTVRVWAIDDAGTTAGSFDLSLQARQTVHFNSNDLENGNASKGIPEGVGTGTGDWRLRFDTDLDLNVLAYVRTGRGFLTSMHDLVLRQAASGPLGNRYVVPIFNPASNNNQVSKLRLVNLADAAAEVTLSAFDDNGQPAPDGDVQFSLAAGAARMLATQELEGGGDNLQGSFGDGAGKWELHVLSSYPLAVMNLMETPAQTGGAANGNLTNLSTRSAVPGIAPAPRSCAPCEVPYFIAADDAARQGFVRISNYSTQGGTVEIHAVDDTGQRFGPVTIALDALAVVHFNSDDLEAGNAAKGISGSLGDGVGDWRLEVRTSLAVVGPLAYVRTKDGFLTAMHDTVRGGADGRRHVVPIFNPASNRDQRSQLRVVNPTPHDAAIAIAGIDDEGQAGADEVTFTLAAGRSRTIDAQHLEEGRDDLAGRLGDGTGKWQLVITSDQPVQVLNTLLSPTGNLTNLSSSPQG